MTWGQKPAKWPWRDYLTVSEALEVSVYEADRESLAGKTANIGLIRNRAIQRAKYAARRASEKERGDVG